MLPSAQFLFLRFAIGMNSLCEMRIIHFHPTLLPDHCFVLTVMIWAGPSLQLEIREICYRITVTRSSARDGAAATTESGEIPGAGAGVMSTVHCPPPDTDAGALAIMLMPMLSLCMTNNACHLNPIMFTHCLGSSLQVNSTNCHDSRVHPRFPFELYFLYKWIYSIDHTTPQPHSMHTHAQGFLFHMLFGLYLD